MKKSWKFLFAAVVFAGAIGYLLVSGFSSESVYYLEVSEVLHNPEKFNKKGMRVSGDVVTGTIVKDFKKQYLEFDIADTSGQAMKVIYNGIIPDTFKEDIQVIIEGRFDQDADVFNAATVLTKCPSKYEADVDEG
ncbi:cytochrome c-type biogenesis protein CcmE [Denitrovibrio acetiphilus DSM 12809]|jgi:cytochrome c-type biogenesis protein CcmE|uniref:Cytochrome c-type biogenesis protein CcmE n=1 Tax=Denitrovibrio acetiphilus (strain DSM 12809 / NBRC 114555 / N2460) TaxID=522772 RepID=D4H2S3_DENA2|nr:cytochrome c maturation protein CcmE [Denitrovibrio acetiphilus]ADD67134.1 cytochrome c-type biogenesis protein CcmE [Denitrovibrio acetiphilus DSM 12809]